MSSVQVRRACSNVDYNLDGGTELTSPIAGAVETPMIRRMEEIQGYKQPLDMACQQRYADPREVATFIAFLLSEDASFITGGVYTIDGGFSA
jgi:3-oxoacyl-[acyl-carrier protein] reductase